MAPTSNNLPDFSVFFRKAISCPKGKDDSVPMIGIDECFNRDEIRHLCINLLNQRQIRGATSLWNQERVKTDGSILNVRGGIDRNDKQYIKAVLDDIGAPKKHYSFPDAEVIEYSLAYLMSYATFVVLSENVKNDEFGLRNLLNKLVKPPLSKCHGLRLRYTVVFKKGKTDINDYCNEVTKLITKNEFSFGYSEYYV